jgi:thiol:disulfide interchange protein DsbD
MRLVLAAMLLLLTTLGQAQGLSVPDGGGFGAGPAEVEFLPVEEAYQLEIEVLDQQGLRLYWQIADDYYLYQHRFAFSLQDSSGQALELNTELPPALARTDEYFGEVQVYYQQADVELRPSQVPADGPAVLSVTSQGCADAGLCYPPQKQRFAVDFKAGTVSAIMPGAADSSSPVVGADAGAALLYMLVLAFIGGAILNLMPCVFPILSLKVLSFARSTDHDRHLHSWVYAAGVISSFVLVAAALIFLQQAGRAVGWGFQLQSPGFVIALAYLFVAMGLSLTGLVEFGGSLMNTGSGLAAKNGLGGSYFTGVLAVVVASPCTAPFMGTALGFAATQPPQVALLVFAALGAGMAAPLMLFSYSGAARKWMPAPGPWMETLKQLLAFPLYGTAIWLLWVAGRQTGVNTMAVALGGALMLALALWLWRQGGWRRGLAAGFVLVAVAMGSWRGLDENGTHAAQLADGKVPWSERQLADLRAAGRPVFVDVTADWCITCIANEVTVLNSDEVNEAFASNGVVYMIADWTNYNPDIARFLERHGRSGIPLYLLYPPDPRADPVKLPQILSKNAVLQALSDISGKTREIARMISENPSTIPSG